MYSSICNKIAVNRAALELSTAIKKQHDYYISTIACKAFLGIPLATTPNTFVKAGLKS